MNHDFIWYDLVVADPRVAADFYGHVVGWTAEVSTDAGFPYTLMKAGAVPVAGIMALPPGMADAPKRWQGYVGVPDADAAAERLKAAGGTVHMPPMDIPSVGRFAAVADPAGAAFMLFTPDGPAPAPLPVMAPGTVGWHQLATPDIERGFAFYAGQFGWEKDEALDMGPGGLYQLWKTGADAGPTGGVTRSDDPHWLYYFAVEDIDAAVARIAGTGGGITSGPDEVPGGAWIVHGRDPQGVAFALVGMRAAEQAA